VGGRWHLCCPAEHVVHRISADRAHVDEPGAFGIRPEPAAAIVRRHGGQTRRTPRRGRVSRSAESAEAVVIGIRFFRKRLRLAASSSFGMFREQLTDALSANGSNRP
jgi:hypothetical protein